MNHAGGAFWSGKTLTERLRLLIDPFSESRVDCASYTLAIGPEVYVSPSDHTVDSANVTVRQLTKDEGFVIPPGQFAFLLTEETVKVPTDALAFISIRAKTKFRGLVNVSGFHVDPGYRGQLTFAVFNAGPIPIHLRRGQPIFLLWYTGLDCNSKFTKNDPVQRGIKPELLTAVAGKLQSFAGLSKRIEDVEKDMRDRIHAVEKDQAYYRVIAAIVLAVMISMAVAWLKDTLVPVP